jgi:hypothetical protein
MNELARFAARALLRHDWAEAVRIWFERADHLLFKIIATGNAGRPVCNAVPVAVSLALILEPWKHRWRDAG